MVESQRVRKIGEFKLLLDQKLGRGSYGEVYKTAKVGDDNNFYATKMMYKTDMKYEIMTKLEERIERSAPILTYFDHPNIVKLNEIMITRNIIFLIFEFCDGGSLKDYLKQKTILEEEEAIEFIKQLVQGMDYWISQKVIHRNINPANILIHSSKKYAFGKLLKIGDYGFARFVQEQAPIIFQPEFPLYLAPEVYFEADYGYKCDIWSLGIILYEMLHRYPPWTGESASDLFHNNIIKKPLIFDIKYIRKDLQNLISRMLKIQQDDRISIDDLKAALVKL